ncbi:hypothetical protein BC938DRAFT_473213 [Jimgerdemannia flammicorona]|uniref:Uncharacterized protein n=1 Tax=Jimgerdemannia flammicorona TaxID=994334 RepID=A0A433Q4I6_9FUNG|nr:hypothetical protein BC938DRAFT_473213 [Jimgerdemannia flammicorona]
MDSLRMLAASCKPWLTKSFGVRGKDYDKSWEDVFKEMEEHKTFTNWVVAWGQRPENGELKTDWEHCGLSSDRFSYMAFNRSGKFGYSDGSGEDDDYEFKEGDPYISEAEDDSGLDSYPPSFRRIPGKIYKGKGLPTDANAETHEGDRPMKPKFPMKMRAPRHRAKPAQFPKFTEGIAGSSSHLNMAGERQTRRDSEAGAHMRLLSDDLTSVDRGKEVPPKFYFDVWQEAEEKFPVFKVDMVKGAAKVFKMGLEKDEDSNVVEEKEVEGGKVEEKETPKNESA